MKKKFIISWTADGYGSNAGYKEVNEDFFIEENGFDEEVIIEVLKLNPGEVITVDQDDVAIVRIIDIVNRI